MKKIIFDKANFKVVTDDDKHLFFTDKLYCGDEVIETVINMYNDGKDLAKIENYLLESCTTEDKELIIESFYNRFNPSNWKTEKIKKLVIEMLNNSHEAMIKKIDSLFISGCIDTESWDENNMPMILPKTIVAALLEDETTQYYGKGTSFEKEVKKEVKNIRYFL